MVAVSDYCLCLWRISLLLDAAWASLLCGLQYPHRLVPKSVTGHICNQGYGRLPEAQSERFLQLFYGGVAVEIKVHGMAA